MPELPEVESTRRSLAHALVGRTLARVDLRRADIVDHPAPSPRDLLDGARVESLRRHGKQLAILSTDGRVLVVQLGMSGVLATGPAPQSPHTHCTWLLSDGGVLWFNDPRRFGGLTPLPDAAALASRWSLLGPDALTVTPDALAAACHGSKRAIKALLLDQHAIAGVGNIYADEALFRSGIRPTTRASRLRPGPLEALAGAIREVLGASIAMGGSTLRDYRDGQGQPGEFQARHDVYGRGGEACRRCGSRLRELILAQRTTVWCPGCQH